MITFFTIPKKFSGLEKIIQMNALRSWKAACPGAEVLVFGDDGGAAEASQLVGAVHIPDIKRTSLGTPLLNDAFSAARQMAKHDTICYVNADIILTSSVMAAAQAVSLDVFLMTGMRWDVAICDFIDFDVHDWERRLEKFVFANGTRHLIGGGMDFFLFRRNALFPLPEFAVGRPVWDNWFVSEAMRRRMAFIDASMDVLAVHQDHSYEHVPNKRGDKWDGPEGDRNHELAVGRSLTTSFEDAPWELVNGRVRTRLYKISYWKRRVKMKMIKYPKMFNSARSVLTKIKKHVVL